ncbi:MAG: DUF86 domain-containing protein [Deltaproteobacteria bacterium]|nr:DUF86 domain-containing protein [Deltaproteobacteria bacterium]
MGETQLDLLGRLLERLDHYAKTVTRASLETDLDTWLMVSRAMELAAQCCVDLALELVAARHLGLPQSYRDAFSRLAQAGILTPQHAAALQGWAGLRNVLAHFYTAVDLDLLHAALLEDHGPLREFGSIAARELGRSDDDSNERG